ncbi:hypothetical protein HDU86_003145 [Geranomyces michiganensis]|nr:hypothetical protein HDU86_003145 [Geranomyces michiganensis]
MQLSASIYLLALCIAGCATAAAAAAAAAAASVVSSSNNNISSSNTTAAAAAAAVAFPLAGLVAMSCHAAAAVALPRVLKRARRSLHDHMRELDVMAIAQKQSKTGSWETYIDPDSGVRYIRGSEQWHQTYGIDRHDSASLLATSSSSSSAASSSVPSTTATRPGTKKPARREPIEWERWNKLILPRDAARSLAFADDIREGKSLETDGVMFELNREDDGAEIAVKTFTHSCGPTTACGATQDITDQLQEKRRLTQMKDDAYKTSAQKDIFLATMSHELRTPLTSIIGHIELLKETRLDKAQKEYIADAFRGAKTLLALINNILDYSKLAAGAVELDIHAMQPAELISDVRAIAKDLSPGVSLDIKSYDGPPTLAADSLKLRQVVVNIAANAMKFSPKNGTVTVEVTCTPVEGNDALLKITVQDNGIGMSEATVARLFTPFVQAEASTSRRYGGTGLGLSIVKRLVSAMNGKITVRSVMKIGTTFEVSLPVRITTAHDKSRSIPSSFSTTSTPPSLVDGSNNSFSGRPMPPTRILLAEDNRITQTLVKRMLRAFPVDAVDNGAEALEKLKEAEAGVLNPYSILLCDLNMAVMGGLETVRAIRKREAEEDGGGGDGGGDGTVVPRQRRRLYVVGLSASVFENDREDCIAAGMDSFLSKPFTKAGLLSAVSAAVAATNPAAIAQALEAARALGRGALPAGDIQANSVLPSCIDDGIKPTSASAAEKTERNTATILKPDSESIDDVGIGVPSDLELQTSATPGQQHQQPDGALSSLPPLPPPPLKSSPASALDGYSQQRPQQSRQQLQQSHRQQQQQHDGVKNLNHPPLEPDAEAVVPKKGKIPSKDTLTENDIYT